MSENVKTITQFCKHKYQGKIIFHLLLDCLVNSNFANPLEKSSKKFRWTPRMKQGDSDFESLSPFFIYIKFAQIQSSKPIYCKSELSLKLSDFLGFNL